MKVFISWSGNTSRLVAQALYNWFPLVLQSVSPWMSSVDIAIGTRWITEIGVQLKESHFGIICLTPVNLQAPWIHFEAGAISKSLQAPYIVPYLFRIRAI